MEIEDKLQVSSCFSPNLPIEQQKRKTPAFSCLAVVTNSQEFDATAFSSDRVCG
jgi:hypothetical protein